MTASAYRPALRPCTDLHLWDVHEPHFSRVVRFGSPDIELVVTDEHGDEYVAVRLFMHDAGSYQRLEDSLQRVCGKSVSYFDSLVACAHRAGHEGDCSWSELPILSYGYVRTSETSP